MRAFAYIFGWVDTHLSMQGVALRIVNERPAETPMEKAFQKIRAVFAEYKQGSKENARLLYLSASGRSRRHPPGLGDRICAVERTPSGDLGIFGVGGVCSCIGRFPPALVELVDDYLRIRKLRDELELTPHCA